MIITLSGPAGSGKGTLAKKIARELELPYYDFGLMFRAIAFVDSLMSLEIKGDKAFYLGEDITERLRTEEAGINATRLVQKLGIEIYSISKKMVAHSSFVCDGRSLGVHYPEAVKFHITASQKERINRRSKEGKNCNIMLQRDMLDKERLDVLDDEIIIDTTGKVPEESLRDILQRIRI